MTFELDPRFTHNMIDLDDVRLHYVRGGSGPTIVLLHGWGSTWYMWRHVMAKLADNFTVIVPDLPGLGDSGMPQKRLSGYDKKTVAKDIHNLVERLGLGPVHVMGHDHGAAVAYAYSASFRDEVRSLVFCEMALMGVAGDKGIEYFMDQREELRLWHLSFHAANHVAEMLIRGREREYLRWFYRMQIFNTEAISDDDIDVYARSYSGPGGLRLEYYRAFYQDGEDNKELSKEKLSIPVLAVGGANSIRELSVSSMEAVANDVEGIIVPDCGHWLPEERPAEFLDSVLTFLKRIETPK